MRRHPLPKTTISLQCHCTILRHSIDAFRIYCDLHNKDTGDSSEARCHYDRVLEYYRISLLMTCCWSDILVISHRLWGDLTQLLSCFYSRIFQSTVKAEIRTRLLNDPSRSSVQDMGAPRLLLPIAWISDDDTTSSVAATDLTMIDRCHR